MNSEMTVSSTVLCRAPLRISLGGGGTDLPSYYEHFESFFVSAAISRYVYVMLTKNIEGKIIIRAPYLQNCLTVDQVEHHGIRHAIKGILPSLSGFELTSQAELPTRSGLGSSGSFYVCLFKALNELISNACSSELIAEQAFNLEANILKAPIGKQDQYIAALGGIRAFSIDQTGNVTSKKLDLSEAAKQQFLSNLALFYTGKVRIAHDVLNEQVESSEAQDKKMLENLHQVKGLGKQANELLLSEQFEAFGLLMHEHWQIKQQRSAKMADSEICHLYEYALKNGAIGGKLIGAGGGGFFLFYCEDKARLINAMKHQQINAVEFYLDEIGVTRLL